MHEVEIRIGELARRAAISPRNIRLYQQRGLLPAPRIRGRTGFYGEEHLQRLELIRRLQDRGFSLEAIRHILDTWVSGGDIAALLGIGESDSWDLGSPVRITLTELEERFPELLADPALLERAIDIGVVARDPDGSYGCPPVLLRVATAFQAMGVDLHETLSVAERVQGDARVLVRHLVGAVGQHVRHGMEHRALDLPALSALTDAAVELRLLAVDALEPFLSRELRSAIEGEVDDFLSDVDPAGDEFGTGGEVSPATSRAGSLCAS